MYRTIQLSLQTRIQAILSAKYDIVLAQFAIEQPPNIALGELALPVAFELPFRGAGRPRRRNPFCRPPPIEKCLCHPPPRSHRRDAGRRSRPGRSEERRVGKE